MILLKYFFSWGKDEIEKKKSKKIQTSVKIFPIGEIKELFYNNFFLLFSYKCVFSSDNI